MKYLGILLLIANLSACNSDGNSQHILSKAILDNAENMTVTYQVISNTAELDCDKNIADGHCYASELHLQFTAALPVEGWQLLFSHQAPIQHEDSEYFNIERINGDLHSMVAIKPIKAGQSFKIGLRSAFWSVAKSDVLPNYFFVYEDDKTAVIKATQEIAVPNHPLPLLPHAGQFDSAEQIKRNSQDKSKRTTASVLFAHNQQIRKSQSASSSNYMVTPSLTAKILTDEKVNLTSGLSIDVTSQHKYAAAWSMLEQSGVEISEQGLPVTIVLQTDSDSFKAQSYQLTTQSDGIAILAADDAGVFYALVTLGQIIDQQKHVIAGEYNDTPRFSFRGIHLDVARNFRSVAFVKTLIDQMAQLKLNKLHLHLADDEGWRLEIEGLEELTQVGAFRCYDPTETRCLLPQLGSGPDYNSSANGYYSLKDYQDILRYASERHVEVIPSLDMPGHSRAAIKSMEARYHKLKNTEQTEAATKYLLSEFEDKTIYSSIQHYNDNTLNPCLPSTYRFVEKVLSSLIEQHVAANVPIKRYHIGADETAGAWHESPACKSLISKTEELESIEQLGGYFVTRVAQMVQDKGIIAGGWSDGMREFKPKVAKPMQVNVWDALMWQGHKAASDFAQQGWRTILSYPDVLYFDFPYSIDPNEPGYYWAGRATDSYKLFQFLPEQPELNSRLWLDNQGHPYSAEEIQDSDAEFEGIQAHLWSELVRHDSVAEYMYFPRLISFAQKAWSKSHWEEDAQHLTDAQLIGQINSDWRAFSTQLVSKLLPKLSKQNIQFRIPPPGAALIEDVLHMNHLYEGMQLQYLLKNGQWINYNKPIQVTDVMMIRALLPKINESDIERFSAAIKLN